VTRLAICFAERVARDGLGEADVEGGRNMGNGSARSIRISKEVCIEGPNFEVDRRFNGLNGDPAEACVLA
jgi:hypothetical protein